jgi:hypothetical protein
VAVNSIYASIIPSYKYNLVLKSFSYGTQVMGHPVYEQVIGIKLKLHFYIILGDYKKLTLFLFGS